jgi:hypothetical protein
MQELVNIWCKAGKEIYLLKRSSTTQTRRAERNNADGMVNSTGSRIVNPA